MGLQFLSITRPVFPRHATLFEQSHRLNIPAKPYSPIVLFIQEVNQESLKNVSICFFSYYLLNKKYAVIAMHYLFSVNVLILSLQLEYRCVNCSDKKLITRPSNELVIWVYGRKTYCKLPVNLKNLATRFSTFLSYTGVKPSRWRVFY